MSTETAVPVPPAGNYDAEMVSRLVRLERLVLRVLGRVEALQAPCPYCEARKGESSCTGSVDAPGGIR
jgi:hypothetical protein